MKHEEILNRLLEKNNSLKKELLKKQLKYDNYSFIHYEKCSKEVLNEYKNTKSLFKSAVNLGIDYNNVLNWYIQGQLGNPQFKEFYTGIININNQDNSTDEIEKPSQAAEEMQMDEDYIISQYGDGWSYKTFVNGEKIFLISNDLETLKSKVKSKRLPID